MLLILLLVFADQIAGEERNNDNECLTDSEHGEVVKNNYAFGVACRKHVLCSIGFP
jgi:hypothetical protein